MKTSIIITIVVIVLGIGGYVWYGQNAHQASAPGDTMQAMPQDQGTQPAQTTPDQTQVQPTDQTATQQPAPQQPSAQPAAGAHVTDTIVNFKYDPNPITIHKGDTITWTNQDSAPHTVTSDTGAFASANLSKGQSWSYTFNTAGTFAYHCAVHPNMHGTVIVQ